MLSVPPNIKNAMVWLLQTQRLDAVRFTPTGERHFRESIGAAAPPAPAHQCSLL
jgi:hypothetical protein